MLTENITEDDIENTILNFQEFSKTKLDGFESYLYNHFPTD